MLLIRRFSAQHRYWNIVMTMSFLSMEVWVGPGPPEWRYKIAKTQNLLFEKFIFRTLTFEGSVSSAYLKKIRKALDFSAFSC